MRQPKHLTDEEYAKLREDRPEGILPRRLRILDTDPDGRHRSFGFHHPQKTRVPKVQHPKPVKA